MPRWLKTGFWAFNLIMILTLANVWLLAADKTDKLLGNGIVDPKLWADTQTGIMESYLATPLFWLLLGTWGYFTLALIYLVESIAKGVHERHGD
jgi:hypothetical protein